MTEATYHHERGKHCPFCLVPEGAHHREGCYMRTNHALTMSYQQRGLLHDAAWNVREEGREEVPATPSMDSEPPDYSEWDEKAKQAYRDTYRDLIASGKSERIARAKARAAAVRARRDEPQRHDCPDVAARKPHPRHDWKGMAGPGPGYWCYGYKPTVDDVVDLAKQVFDENADEIIDWGLRMMRGLVSKKDASG